jgi:hypothetical protein
MTSVDARVIRNADIRNGEEADEIFRFIDFLTREHGKAPQHLVFDSKLTTYAGLDRLDAQGITFIILRRRSPKLLTEVANLPKSAWRTVELDVPNRKYRHPRFYEQKARPWIAFTSTTAVAQPLLKSAQVGNPLARCGFSRRGSEKCRLT